MIDDSVEGTPVMGAEATSREDGAANVTEHGEPELQRFDTLLAEDLPWEVLPAAEAPLEEFSEQPGPGANGSTGTEAGVAAAPAASGDASGMLTDDSAGDRADDVATRDDSSVAPVLTGMWSEQEPGGAAPALDSAVDVPPAEVVSPAALVTALVETAAPRRNRRRSSRDGLEGTNDALQPGGMAAAGEDSDSRSVEDYPQVDAFTLPVHSLATPLAEEDQDTPLWREQWPMNEVRMVGRLLARSSDAPALDGVQRTRMELALVEQHGDEFGSMGTLPIFVMPGALGFTSIAAEIRRARREKRRLAPIMVDVQGILRQLPDRDGRYATERYRVLMGVEVHRITRLGDDAEQFAYWRGRATVTASRRYDYRGMPYQRVTAVVELVQRKPRLRGTSITHLPVDFLVAPGHEHADRFEHIGQRLLIEAAITPETQRMNDNHPDLLGIDDPRRKAQLQVLRESVVSVTMGEFPDEAAEHAYEAWVEAGRPRPERRGRVPRSTVIGQSAPSTAHPVVPDRAVEPRRGRQQASSSRGSEQKRGSSA